MYEETDSGGTPTVKGNFDLHLEHVQQRETPKDPEHSLENCLVRICRDLDSVLESLQQIGSQEALLHSALESGGELLKASKKQLEDSAEDQQTQFSAVRTMLTTLQNEQRATRGALQLNGETVAELREAFNGSIVRRLAETMSDFCAEMKPIIQPGDYDVFFVPLIEDVVGRFGLELINPNIGSIFDPTMMLPDRQSETGHPGQMTVKNIMAPGMRKGGNVIVRATVLLKPDACSQVQQTRYQAPVVNQSQSFEATA